MDARTPSDNKDLTMVALFDHLMQLERALAELQAVGMTKDQIGFICRVVRGAGDTAKCRENATMAGAGASEHSSLGVSAGVLPPIGQVVAGGTLNSVLASAVLGATSNGLVDNLLSYGFRSDTARHFVEQIVTGKIVLIVRGGERAEWVKSVMRNNGALDVRSTTDANEGERT